MFPAPAPSLHAALAAGSISDPVGNAALGYSTDFFILTADANHDRYVNTADFTALAINFNKSSGMTYSTGDFNRDGKVNALDFNALATGFGSYLAPISGSIPGNQAAAVLAPERHAGLFGDEAIRDEELLSI